MRVGFGLPGPDLGTDHKTAAIDATVPIIPFKSINILITDRITIGKMQYPKTEAITPT